MASWRHQLYAAWRPESAFGCGVAHLHAIRGHASTVWPHTAMTVIWPMACPSGLGQSGTAMALLSWKWHAMALHQLCESYWPAAASNIGGGYQLACHQLFGRRGHAADWLISRLAASLIKYVSQQHAASWPQWQLSNTSASHCNGLACGLSAGPAIAMAAVSRGIYKLSQPSISWGCLCQSLSLSAIKLSASLTDRPLSLVALIDQ